MRRTDTILDQDCGLKARCVSMYTVTVVSLSTTSVVFNTLPLTQIAPFDAKIRRLSRGMIHKNQRRHVCHLILV